MLIIGERINSTRKPIARAVAERDEAFIRQEAAKQVAAGAQMLDVNCGTLDTGQEPATLQWLAATVQDETGIQLCIDSPNPAALAAALSIHKGKALVNSISGETERFRRVLPLVKEYKTKVIALGIDDEGIPSAGGRALEVGTRLVNRLVDAGVGLDDIYFDPLVRCISADPESVLSSLEVMREMATRFKGLHLVSGLSNVSYGLPERRHLNRAFLVLSIASGLDAVIVDPTDPTSMALALSTEALLNRDRYCMNYLRAYRAGKLSADK